jgi:C4-dicarboxylate-specific signal transduction histidine kinase
VASPVTATDLNEAVRTVQPLLECLLRPSVRLNLRLATEDCLTQADAGQIEQLVINLGVNAVDAMPNGGVLTIRTERRTSQRKDADRGEVALTVHDTGDTPGGDHVFAVFHERGDGQWMNAAARTARAIVGRYGGRLEVAPSPGGGTAWSAAFPEVHATSWAF